jgi:hypothetical protein
VSGASRDNNYPDDPDDSVSGHSGPSFGPELVVEETMCVCFALANAAAFSKSCATRLLDNGLMGVMLRIAGTCLA